MTRTHSVRRPVSGFTLIELLVVTLILSILMAVAIPLYLSSAADARQKTCRANMQTIANAVQAAHIKAVDTDYTNTAYMGTVDSSKVGPSGGLADLQSVPVCPNDPNAKYNVVADAQTGFAVTCTASPSDGTYHPGQPFPKGQ